MTVRFSKRVIRPSSGAVRGDLGSRGVAVVVQLELGDIAGGIDRPERNQIEAILLEGDALRRPTDPAASGAAEGRRHPADRDLDGVVADPPGDVDRKCGMDGARDRGQVVDQRRVVVDRESRVAVAVLPAASVAVTAKVWTPPVEYGEPRM